LHSEGHVSVISVSPAAQSLSVTEQNMLMTGYSAKFQQNPIIPSNSNEGLGCTAPQAEAAYRTVKRIQ